MDQTLHIGALSITMQAVYFDKATSFRTIDLSANYSELDLVRIIRKNYRYEELVFNNLYANLQRTKYDYENRLIGAYNLLKHYGIKYEELEALIDKKLGMD